ncbi:1-acyl-sn-glycerol-3-phosphate acyltransferase [Lasiosphaeria miniovina]|uniref:1-acyl-sn-glycerol-3-phosphate acyltransferase n=1 Tax=Lasiosphaeria miniovina TaxID=1954250 RepID=A0AA40DVC1_9PEZI|nr:1-acyl-sn-glycerol-3-phosphate acyltransferase [Lasiosphaeria miniovina]KAK0716960.1 1-acyl-sn-glycerol-3-phosphate acyltransferase [Lasiosphaeria miniovina]
MAQFPKGIATHLRGIALTVPWLLWLLVADVLLSFLLPFKFLFPDAVYNASSRIALSVWLWIQSIFEVFNSAVITVSGDRLPPHESAIVIANHVSWSDFYMIQAMAVQAGMLGRCRWFAKQQLRFVPFLGWGLWAMGMPLVSRNWLRDKAELDRVFRGITKRKWPIWLISFSEATRFTRKKYLESEQWCANNNKPQPLHLLYPRTKGFVATVQHLRKTSHIKAVYDFTIAYQHGRHWQGAPEMWDTLSIPRLSGPAHNVPQQMRGEGYRFHVHARRFPLEELPHDDEGLAKWLEARWVEKGKWLDETKALWVDEGKTM